MTRADQANTNTSHGTDAITRRTLLQALSGLLVAGAAGAAQGTGQSTVKSVFTPEVRVHMQRAGVDEVTAIQRAMQFALSVEADPVRHIQKLMRSRNIDPKLFLQGQDQNGQAQPDAVQQVEVV